jgi:hypothetical protein
MHVGVRALCIGYFNIICGRDPLAFGVDADGVDPSDIRANPDRASVACIVDGVVDGVVVAIWTSPGRTSVACVDIGIAPRKPRPTPVPQRGPVTLSVDEVDGTLTCKSPSGGAPTDEADGERTGHQNPSSSLPELLRFPPPVAIPNLPSRNGPGRQHT